MPKLLNVLILEDNPADAELLLIELRRAGFEPDYQIVDNEKGFAAHLKPELDLILSDYSLPQFTGFQALHLRNESGFDTPFIIVSGTIGEEIAVESICQGADDYLMKDRMKRLGSAVANAIKKKELRDEKRQTRQEIEMLLALSRQASAETSLDDLLFFIANQIVEVIPHAEASSIFLYDEERKVINIQAWAGLSNNDVKGMEFNVDGSLAGRLFRNKKPTIINESAKDPDFKMIEKLDTDSIKSQMGVPLFFKKRIVGIIFADNLTRTDAFSQENLDLLESIGNQLAGMIENARLLDQVKESEEQYHSVVDDSPGLINRFLPDGTITFVNNGYCKFFGKKSDELIGMNLQFAIPEEDRESVMSNIVSLTKESPVQTFENKVTRHDGEVRWIRWTDRALFDDKGQKITIQSFGEDITASKKAEEKLKISEEQYRSLFNSMLNGFALHEMVYDDAGKPIDYRFIEVNPAFEKLTGLRVEDIIGKTVLEVMPKTESHWIETYGKVALTSEPVFFEQFAQELNKHFEVIAFSPKKDQFATICSDITERKIFTRELQQERDKAQKYLDIAEVMIVALNKEGEITLVNQKGASILGYKIEDMAGKNWFDTFLPAADRAQAKKMFKDFMANGVGLGGQFEQTIVTKSGEERIIDWHSTPLWEWDDEVKHRVGSLSSGEDITEHKQAVQKLQESEKYQKTIFETTSLATIIIEEDTTISMANNEFEKLSGYSKEELEGRMSWTVFVAKEDLKRMQDCHHQRRINPDATVKQCEFQFINRKGIVRNILIYVDLILETKKSVASFLDFTERKRAEQLLNALNRAAVAMGASQTHQDIFNAVAKEFKQLDISCMLFPLDETQGKLITKYISYESALLTTAEKLLGIKHEDYSFPIDAVDISREVIGEKKTLFSDNSGQILWQILPKSSKNILAQLTKILRVQKSISAPLIVEDQVIGVFSIQSDKLTREDIPAATAFADQLASAWNKIKLLKDLRKTVKGTVHIIAATVEARDPYTAGHQTRVSDLAAAIAIEMKLTDEQVEGIKMAGIIHDLGKINIPAEILSKPGALSELEYKIIQTHPQVGFDLLKEIEFPWPIAEMVHQHHEKMDGSGYPQGLKGDDILLEARILAVADIVEAMSSHRPYRPAHDIEKAFKQIKKDKGTLLDPKVVNACLKIFKEGYKLLEN